MTDGNKYTDHIQTIYREWWALEHSALNRMFPINPSLPSWLREWYRGGWKSVRYTEKVEHQRTKTLQTQKDQHTYELTEPELNAQVLQMTAPNGIQELEEKWIIHHP